jgi:hypothetical protein
MVISDVVIVREVDNADGDGIDLSNNNVNNNINNNNVMGIDNIDIDNGGNEGNELNDKVIRSLSEVDEEVRTCVH